MSADTSIIKVEMPRDVKNMLDLTAKRMGVRQSILAGLWMSMLDPNNEALREKVLSIKAKEEVNRLSSTRNALVDRLRKRGALQVIDEMSEKELGDMVNKIKNKKRGKS